EAVVVAVAVVAHRNSILLGWWRELGSSSSKTDSPATLFPAILAKIASPVRGGALRLFRRRCGRGARKQRDELLELGNAQVGRGPEFHSAIAPMNEMVPLLGRQCRGVRTAVVDRP